MWNLENYIEKSGYKAIATDLQIQNTQKLLQKIYKYKVQLCAEFR